jgi:hypothetical protein
MVAPTMLRKHPEKSVYGRGDPCGRPGPDRHGRPGRGASLRPGNSIIHYIAGTLALALACFSLVCIISFTTAAHASVGSGYHNAQTPLTATPTDTSTPSPTVTSTPSPTVTTTPSPTVTSTPSPTVTSTPSPTVTTTPSPTATTTPAPSPSATRNIFPSPTSSSTVAASPTSGATPTGTNTNTQGPGGSPTPANNPSDPSSQGTNPLANVLPFILICLGVIALLALLFIPARIMLRKRLVPIPSPKVPPSGAAPWTRTPTSSLPIQPIIQQAHGIFNTSNSAPPVVPSTNGYFGPTQSQSYQSFSTPPVVPTWNAGNRQNSGPVAQSDAWLLGEAQNQPPIPTTPPLIPKVQAEYGGNQPGQTISPAPPGNPFIGERQPFDSSYPEARKRLRRNGLHATGEQIAYPEQISGELSTDMMVVSDPYLRAMLKQYSQKGQTIKQAPEELS